MAIGAVKLQPVTSGRCTCHGRGRGFEFRRPHHIFNDLEKNPEKTWVGPPCIILSESRNVPFNNTLYWMSINLLIESKPPSRMAFTARRATLNRGARDLMHHGFKGGGEPDIW